MRQLAHEIRLSPGAELYSMLDPLLSAQPNSAHILLGELATRSCQILTTNFGRLIEVSRPGASVTHLHGDVTDFDSLVIRIEQVGLGLLPPLRKFFCSTVRTKRLFILGYSGRDRDIIQAVNASKPSQVWWADIEVPPGLAALKVGDVRLCVSRLEVLIQSLAKAVGVNCSVYPPATLREPPTSRRINVLDWRRFFAIAKIAGEAGLLDLSVRACSLAVPLIERPSELIFLAAQAVVCLRELGRMDEAHDWVQKGLSQAHLADDELKAGIYNTQGYMALERDPPDVSGAIKALRGALLHQTRFARAKQGKPRVNDRLVFVGRIWNNFGWAYHVGRRYDEAATAYRESLKIKRSVGDLPGVASTTANLARALYETGRWAEAASWRSRARRLCAENGLPNQEATILRDMSRVAIRQGRRRTAERWLREAALLVKDSDFNLIRETIEDLQLS